MIQKIVITLGLSLILSGCSTFTPPWEDYKGYRYNDKLIKSYELEKKYTVSVGDPLISASKVTLETYYQPLTRNAVIWGGRTVVNFDTGTAYSSERLSEDSRKHFRKWVPVFEYNGEDGDYVLTSKIFFQGAIGIIVNDNGSVPVNPVMRIDKKGSTERFPIESNLLFRKATPLANVDGNFKFELVYTGKTNNSINVVYREYIDNLARNSFYQNLTYDLNESNIIKFKSIKIEILSSSNSELVFKVVKDDDLKWVQ